MSDAPEHEGESDALPDELRELLGVERGATELGGDAVERIHRGVRERVSGGAGGGGATPSRSGGAGGGASSAGGLGAAGRWAERAGLLGVGAVLGMVAHAGLARPEARAVEPVAVVRAVEASALANDRPSSVVRPSAEGAHIEGTVAPAATSATASAERRAIEPRASAGAGAGADGTLAAERVLIDAASSAAARGRWGDVLTACDEHARRFVRGELTEEREALRVRALAGNGQREIAWARAQVFYRRFPESMLRGAVERAVGSGER